MIVDNVNIERRENKKKVLIEAKNILIVSTYISTRK